MLVLGSYMVEKYYTPKQIAEILQVHQYTVLKWIREGRLHALKFGRVYRTTESELELFLAQIEPRSHRSTEVIHKNQNKQSLATLPQEIVKVPDPEEYSLELETQPVTSETPQDHYIL